MKNRLFLFFVAFALVACQNGKPQAQGDEETAMTAADSLARQVAEKTVAQPTYDLTDALAFGLNGHVQNVSLHVYTTTENEGELTEGAEAGSREMTFDERGHVTIDEWGNAYGYDAEGNYYRGNHVYTIVKRDKNGRIEKYVDEEPKTDNESNQTYTLKYDKNGRIASVENAGWTGGFTEKRHYKSGNLYPSKIEGESYYEGGGGDTYSVAYTYNRFDEKGNWTERTCVMTQTETAEDASEDDAAWGEAAETTKVTETITIEKRSISYYE